MPQILERAAEALGPASAGRRFGRDRRNSPARLSKAMYDEIFAWFDENHAAGRIADGGAELQPVTTATTVRSGDGGEPVVVDGPFADTKEVVGGFTVVDVPDLDAALAMARSWPPLKWPGVSVEVRPIVDHGEG